MTPQEKAKELVEQFRPHTRLFTEDEGWFDHPNSAKKCALICVEEIITAVNAFGYSPTIYDDYETGGIANAEVKLPCEYWQQVINELEKMKL